MFGNNVECSRNSNPNIIDLINTKYQMSSADVDKNLCASLLTLDCFATYFVRYADVFVNQSPKFAGIVIILLAAHWVLACAIITILFAVAALFVWQMQSRRQKDFNQSQEHLKALIGTLSRAHFAAAPSGIVDGDNGSLELTEARFETLLSSDFEAIKSVVHPVFDQCKSMKVVFNTAEKIEQFSIELNPDSNPSFLMRTLKFFEEVLGMLSWIYWITYLPYAICYGSFAAVVVSPALIVIPLLLFIVFFAFKQMLQSDECRKSQRASYLINYVNTLLVFVQKKHNTNNNNPAVEQPLSPLGEDEVGFKMRKFWCGLAQFVRGFVGMYIALEFSAWYLTDAGNKLIIPIGHALFGLIMAHPLACCAVLLLALFVLFAAHKSLQNSELYQNCLPIVGGMGMSVVVSAVLSGVFVCATAVNLGSWLVVGIFIVLGIINACYNASQKVNNLPQKSGSDLLQEFYNTAAGSTWQNVVHGIKDFFASAMTGILFVRMLLIPSTANFAPWLQHVELLGRSWKVIGAMLAGGSIFSAITVSNNVNNRMEKWRMQKFVKNFVDTLPKEITLVEGDTTQLLNSYS